MKNLKIFLYTCLIASISFIGCQKDQTERSVTSNVRIQAFRFDSADPNGIPKFYSQRAEANGIPIVASAKVNPYALKEAAYLVNLMLDNALSDSGYVRENVKRFVISYPTPRMEDAVEGLFLRADSRTIGFVKDLQAHFWYNKGVYQALTAKEAAGNSELYFDALDDLKRAGQISEDLERSEALKYTKVEYAKGWVKALGAKQGIGGEFTKESAAKDLSKFVQEVESFKGAYSYPGQVDAAKSYLEGNESAFQ